MQINPGITIDAGSISSNNKVKAIPEKELRAPGQRQSGEVRQQRQPRSQVGHHNHNQSQNLERVSVDEIEVMRAIEFANVSLEAAFTNFEFSIHEGTREIMVKIVDRDSGEVIREIPPEHILDMVAKMWELAGILVDERV